MEKPTFDAPKPHHSGAHGQSLGIFLKTLRQEKDISLEEISSTTKISLTILKKIETEQLDDVPGPPFIYGYLNQYAKCIAVDPALIIEKYKESYSTGISDSSKQGERLREHPLVHKPNVDRFNGLFEPKRIIPPLIFLMTAGLLGGLYYLGRNFYQANDPAVEVSPKSENIAAVKTKDAKGDETKVQNGDKKPIDANLNAQIHPAAASSIATPSAATNGAILEKHTFQFYGAQGSWLKLFIKGQKPFEATLEKGETYTITVNGALDIIFGNAGGTTINYKGKSYSPVGEVGQVRRIILPEYLKNLKEIKP